MINFRQFQYVLVLAEKKNFSLAAEQLGISQPSLSQYIKKIESEVGMPLFERTSSSVRLTDAGWVYIEAGKKILSIKKQMQNELTDIANYKKGTIRVGISPYRSVHTMPEAVKQFNKLYPGISLVLDERSGEELIDAAEHGEFDICIIKLPIDEKKFNFEHINDEEIVIAVNKQNRLYDILKSKAKVVEGRKFPAVDIKLLHGHEFARLSEYMPMRRITDDIVEKYDLDLKYKVEVSSNEALKTMVYSGICSSFVTSELTSFTQEDIAFFSIQQEIPVRKIGAIYLKNYYISKPISDLIQILKTQK